MEQPGRNAELRILGLLFPFLIAACTLVKEERTGCPGWVYFDIANASRFDASETVFLSASNASEELMEETAVRRGDIQEGGFGLEVRDVVVLQGYGLIGKEGLWQEGSAWRAPLGGDFVPLFRFSYRTLVQGGEEVVIPVEFVKDYCQVTLHFAGDGGGFPYTVVVKANTVGIDAQRGTPLPGTYDYAPGQLPDGRYVFTLPRLGDEELTLEVSGQDGRTDRLDLYAQLRGKVDFKARNLPDVTLEVEYPRMKVHVCVLEWNEKQLEYEY